MRPMEVRLVGRFKFHSKLQGEHETLLYRATHTQTNDRLILKGQQIKTVKPKRGSLSLLQEGKIYQTMQGGIGIPYMQWCGQEEDYNFIVLEELQTTLTKLLAQCEGSFSIKTAAMIGGQLINILQYFHFKYFVYNNLSPRHLMIGRGEKYGQLFIIDYSKVSRYRDSSSLQHIPDRLDNAAELRNYNMQFSSLNYHKGGIVSRKDDMQSFLYFVLYIIEGELPWSAEVRNMKKTDFQKSRQVLELKQIHGGKMFKKYPQLQVLYTHTLSLKFDQKPQYSYYSSMMTQLLERNGDVDDKIYDWMLLQDEEEIDELNCRFDLLQNENEFLQKVSGEARIAMTETSSSKTTGLKTVQIREGRHSKSDKQCNIY